MMLTLLTRPGCHLCDEMKQVVTEVRRTVAFKLREIDVARRADLEHQYGIDVPVLLLDDTPIAKHRTTAAALIERLHRAHSDDATTSP